MLIVKWGRGAIEPLHRDPAYRWLCLGDALHWGPQHVELETEVRMRMDFHRSTFPADEQATLAQCEAALLAGEDVRLWCEPTLGCSLALLRLLHWLHAGNAPVSTLRLARASGVAGCERLRRDSVLQALEQAVPAAAYLPALAELRGHIAAEQRKLDPDLSRVPEPVRDHFASVRLLLDFLPDDRGLDVVDRCFFEHLSGDWTPAVNLIGAGVVHLPRAYDMGDMMLWDRALELCGLFPGGWRCQWRKELVDPDFAAGCTLQTARFRLSEWGVAVKEGRAEAWGRRLYRWVGGRLISHDPALGEPEDDLE